MAKIRHFWVTQLVIERDFGDIGDTTDDEMYEHIKEYKKRIKRILGMALFNEPCTWSFHSDVQRMQRVEDD